MAQSSGPRCPHCGRALQTAGFTLPPTCPHCGGASRVQDETTQAVDTAQQYSIEQRSAILEERIGQLVRHGYRVTSRTETTAQLVKPKEFSLLWALVWLLVTLCVFGLGIIIYLFYYLAQKDQTAYLEVGPHGDVNVTPESARRLIGGQREGKPVDRRPTETTRGKDTAFRVLGVVLELAVAGVTVFCCVMAALAPESPSYSATATAMTHTIRTAQPTGTATRVPPAVSTAVPTPSYLTYTVESGDTLSSIASDFGTTVETIMDFNGLTSTTIYSGTELLIPAAGASLATSPTPSTQVSTPTARPPTPTRQPSATPIQQLRGVYIGMPADNVLRIWGKGVRTEVLGEDSEGLVVAWVYQDARLIMKRSWLADTYQYRVAEIHLR